ncbi:MAG: NADH-quinone oxidoreductase subunit C [Candidatus Omnitrophica bacterium]|nr:NADH-quinone oxidoreductase subunit C [Candidatus Omnitrophota bacterium]
MRQEAIIQNIKVRSDKDLSEVIHKSKNRVYCTINKNILPQIARYLFNEEKARFSIASGVDTRKAVEILYHFSIDEIGLIVTLRVILDKSNLEVESLTPLMKCAEWIEMEIHEMLGVNFKGHPNLKHLLLKDDWPKGNYPLRRDSN